MRQEDRVDYLSRCQVKRCSAEPLLHLFGVGVCALHWEDAAAFDGLLREWCVKRLNRQAASEVKRVLASNDDN